MHKPSLWSLGASFNIKHCTSTSYDISKMVVTYAVTHITWWTSPELCEFCTVNDERIKGYAVSAHIRTMQVWPGPFQVRGLGTSSTHPNLSEVNLASLLQLATNIGGTDGMGYQPIDQSFIQVLNWVVWNSWMWLRLTHAPPNEL